MGSEHYCLRWNNHQSNLLGVFSQLLRDESLVDVTLACSEGHSIRAHKVVLSACSSYFQTLFVDHPSRHPIVILKDVRFAELRTLVEFMYKGEVNVEYCQLSALLKTAESLKVKGLAEMTNLSSSGGGTSEGGSSTTKQEMCDDLEHEPEQTEPTELVSKPSACSPAPAVATTISTTTTSPSTSTCAVPTEDTITGEREREAKSDHKERDREPLRDRERDSHRDFYRDKDRDRDRDREKAERRAERERERERNRERDLLLRDHVSTPPKLCHTPPDRASLAGSSPPPERTRSSSGPPLGMEEQCRPSDMSLHNNGTTATYSTTLGLGCNRLPSPILNEPLPGPSNMPPVQQVPLSLKKEVDWGGGGGSGGGVGLADDKSTGESSSDYPRHSHDPDLDGREAAGSPRVYSCMYCGTTFQHQSKLTRHILSHSLESLKYREQQHPLPHCPLVSESPLLDFSGGVTRPGFSLHHDPPDSLVLGDGTHPSPMDIELSADGPGVVLCKFCGKSFPDVSSLITHLPVHTGDRPFKCEFCGKAFKLRHHMKDHCRVHTGERPFRCTLCGKTFSRSTILKAHEKTHYPKYVRKFLSPSPLDTKEESPH